MSYSASTMGLPELRHSRSARCAASLRMRSARRKRMRPRSCAVVCGHAPELKAVLAAATARSTSFSSASGTSAMISSVAGLITGKSLPLRASTNLPLIYILYLRALAFDFAFFVAIALALLATEPPCWCQSKLKAYRAGLGHFAPAVHIKEKYGEADEKCRAAEHPGFVGQQRANLLCRKKCQHDAERSGDEAAAPCEKQRRLAIQPFARFRRIRGDFQQRGEHIQKRNELQHDCQRQQPQKCFLHARAKGIYQHQNHGYDALHDQRCVWRGKARMRLPQPAGHVRIQACHKRNARRTSEPRRADSGDGNTEHQREWRYDPIGADAAGHMTDGLHDSLQHVDVALADRDQQRQRRGDIHHAGKYSAPGYRARQSFLRVFDFVAHHGRQLQPHQSKTNYAKRIQHKPRIGGDAKIRRGDRGSKSRIHDQPQADQNRGSDSRADSAEIVDPLPDAEAHDIQNHQQRHEQERRNHCERGIFGQRLVAGAQHEHRDAHEIEHHRRHVHHVVGPVAPTGQETVEVAEYFLGPQINATFAGITMCQLDHGNSLRPEKKHERNQPKPNCDSAVRGDAGNHVEVEDRDDEERDEVPTAERTLQMNRFSCGCDWIGQRDSSSTSYNSRAKRSGGSRLARCVSRAAPRGRRTNAFVRDGCKPQWPALTAMCGSFCALARAGAISAKVAMWRSMSASVWATEMVHCSSHQYGWAMTPRLTMANQ